MSAAASSKMLWDSESGVSGTKRDVKVSGLGEKLTDLKLGG